MNKEAFQFGNEERESQPLLDWSSVPLKNSVDNNKLEFNHDQHFRKDCFKEDEVEYMLNLVRFSPSDFQNIDMLKPLFNKTLNTLELLMEEVSLGSHFDKLASRIFEISPENTLKLLLRCKMMFLTRTALIDILTLITHREVSNQINILVQTQRTQSFRSFK